MNPNSAAVERAFEDFLGTRGLQLQTLTLGTAFKALLEFHRDVTFDWVDPDWDALSLEWDALHQPDSSSAGFLGIFKTVTKGDLTGYRLLVSRTLESLEEDGSAFVVLSVVLEYGVTAATTVAFGDGPQEQMIDRHDFGTLEEFVQAVLEGDLFTALALEAPRSVAVTLEAL